MNETRTNAGSLLLAFFASAIALLIAVVVVPGKIAYAEDAEAQVVASWQIGSPTPSNVIATLYDDGSLIIAGSGDTKNYTYYSKPVWYENHRFDIKKVVFEDGVTPDNLMYYFYCCMNLSSINRIPETVTNMSYTFAGTNNLDTKVNEYLNELKDIPELPAGLTNMNYTFQNCRGLEKSPIIPDSVTTMTGTFMNCTSLVSVPNLPANLTNMSSTFASCHCLESVPEIPEGVTLMGNTFGMCSALKSAVYIPSTVINMNNTFQRCTNLTIIPKGWSIPEGLASNRTMYTLAIKEGMDAPYGKNNKLKTYCDPSDYERLSTDPRLTWDTWNRELISGYPDNQEGTAEG